MSLVVRTAHATSFGVARSNFSLVSQELRFDIRRKIWQRRLPVIAIEEILMKNMYYCFMTALKNGFWCLGVLMLAWPAFAQRSFETDILADTFGFDDATPKSVSLDDLQQGCPARDCIPSIDDPKFVAVAGAGHVADDDIVLALAWKGEYRAYPTRILDQHEIVNDVVAGTPIAITYCPLCGSGVGVRREIDGKVVEFGVSGVLYNSDLVLYDRTTETLWDQIIAEGIVGPLTGNKLELVAITMTRWSTWKAAHPDTLVLSPDPDNGRDYTQDYYAKYRQEDRLVFPVSRSSDTVRPKTVVYGFDLGKHSVAITESLLQQSSQYEWNAEGRTISFSLSEDGSVEARDLESGDTFMATRLFWFAWFTFHPQTELLQ